MNTIKKTLAIGLFLLTNIIAGFSQLLGNYDPQDTIEIRKGSTVTYSVTVIPGDSVAWEIIGGTPTPAPTSGSGTAASPYIIKFAPGLNQISVNWNVDDNTTLSAIGSVRAQKRNGGGCTSSISDLTVYCWSVPTANITEPALAAICSGSNSGLSVAVKVTGAPGFVVNYSITNNLLKTPVTSPGTISDNPDASGLVYIPIPDGSLINQTNAPQTYTITLTDMHDAFQGNGTVTATAYSITVNPGSTMGNITVSPASLIRR